VRVAVANTRQSLTGSALDHLVIPRPGGFLDAALGFGVLAGDALGVDAQKDVDTVARPLCDLGSGYARIDNYLHFFNAAPLRSAARRYPHGAARAALWLEAPRARARQPDASTRLTRGGSSPLPDSPASAGTRRGRSASPAAMWRDGLRPPPTEPGRESPVLCSYRGREPTVHVPCLGD
jgi:hypothetical protein